MLSQKLKIISAAGLMVVLGSVSACQSPSIKIRKAWSVPVSSLGRLNVSYRLLGTVTGQGCVNKEARGWKPEAYTFYGAPGRDAVGTAEKIALYRAAKSRPDADLLVRISSMVKRTSTSICASVRAKALTVEKVE